MLSAKRTYFMIYTEKYLGRDLAHFPPLLLQIAYNLNLLFLNAKKMKLKFLGLFRKIFDALKELNYTLTCRKPTILDSNTKFSHSHPPNDHKG